MEDVLRDGRELTKEKEVWGDPQKLAAPLSEYFPAPIAASRPPALNFLPWHYFGVLVGLVRHHFIKQTNPNPSWCQFYPNEKSEKDAVPKMSIASKLMEQGTGSQV